MRFSELFLALVLAACQSTPQRTPLPEETPIIPSSTPLPTFTPDPPDRHSQRSLDPLMQLYGIVSHRFVNCDGMACEPDPLVMKQRISVERALQMPSMDRS